MPVTSIPREAYAACEQAAAVRGRLASAWICRACGALLKSLGRYCGACGNDLAAELPPDWTHAGGSFFALNTSSHYRSYSEEIRGIKAKLRTAESTDEHG